MLTQNQRFSIKSIVEIPFGKFALFVVSLPLLSFIFCVVWSLIFDYSQSTSTHCRVNNYLPSISAAIGGYQPQRIIWQLAIGLHWIPRLYVIFFYKQHYDRTIRKNRRTLAYIACLLNFVENTALLFLSYFTSVSNYEIHKTSFVVFIVTSELYMLISYFINKNARKLDDFTLNEIKSLKWKGNLFVINLLAFIIALGCFIRHNSHCEPGMYSLFAFFEYIVVLSNMGYHMTAFWDFCDCHIIYNWKYGLLFSNAKDQYLLTNM